MITKQELFDNTWNWHIVARNPSGFDTGENCMSCQYRTSEGHRCAIGASIPDNMYRNELEGASVHVIFESVFGTLDEETIEFARALQSAHDVVASRYLSNDEFTFYYEQELRTLAFEYGLTIPS